MNLLAASSHYIDSPFNFTLPAELEASEPPEAHGLARDEVRLMISYRSDNRVVHTRFRELGAYLEAGDLLVINTSGTLNAALPATRADGTTCELHLSTHLPADLWTVEVRLPIGPTTQPFYDAEVGEVLQLPASATATLHVPYAQQRSGGMLSSSKSMSLVPAGEKSRTRLWVATLQLPDSLQDYLTRYGFPIRYSYIRRQWPISYYQTVYATEPGSAEMPSAGRAFTPELITRLVAHGTSSYEW